MNTIDTPAVAADKKQLMLELKQLIITECDKEDEFSAEQISDQESLVGAEARLELDSLDTLQLSLAIKQRYKVRIEGSKEGRKAFASVDAMADYILAGTGGNAG
jgi:acyl carrier protein